MASDPRARLIENPFLVLGLPTSCTRAEAEREASKLLGLLAVGVASASTFGSPLGRHPRTADAVRRAIAELRDPAQRLLAELWANGAVGESADASNVSHATADGPAPGWPDALEALALRPRPTKAPR